MADYDPAQLERLYALLKRTTTMYRKGDVVTEEDTNGVHVVNVFGYPHVSEASGLVVDCHFVAVGVNDVSDETREEFRALCDAYPQPESLAGGPSYITVGAVLGSQDAAFKMFALGEALGFWHVITPRKLFGKAMTEDEGMTDAQADAMAGTGFIMCSGYRPEEAVA